MNSEDKQMKRGKSQSLYKYLPDSWIDFSVRGKDRRQYIAKVDHWNSEPLTGINAKRLIRTVNHAVKSFQAQSSQGSTIPAVTGFGAELTQNNCDVLTPKVSEQERGIVAKISPLTFYCKKCHKVYQFSSEENYLRNHRCKKCNTELSQFRQIYFCKCGYATDKHPARCPIHGSEHLYWDEGYNFICRACNRKIPMQVRCPECNSLLGAKNALDPSQFFTFSLSLIDLIDERLERFISETDYGMYITIAYWLDRINKDKLNEIIDKGITSDPEQYAKEYKKNYEMFLALGDETMAKNAAKLATDRAVGNSYLPLIEELKGKLFATINNLSMSAEMILEFSMVRDLKDQATLEKAKEVAKLLNTTANPDSYDKISNKLGFSSVRACDKIPFVTCSYGYTRGKPAFEDGVQLNALKEEKNGRKNIYATRMNTEGVLFEFDRKQIITWLLQNKYISSNEAPDVDSEEEVKLWFINNIKPDEIHSFTNIDDTISSTTYYVYRLIHSISHLIIRAAAEIGGLGKDSLSEYIFPGIPAVLIYVQNSQGFNLGSLFNTFEAYFDKWMIRACTSAQKCVFDPICLERYKACTGCLFLNEVSCQHFNKDLDRSLVIGYMDKQTKCRSIGFWEE